MANEITLKNAQTAGYLAICPEFIEKRTIYFIEFLKNVRSNNYLLVFNYHRRPNEYENKLIEEFYGKLM
jgi:hypothetical protein